jgi:uncharacterized protein with HEPN domain
LTSRDLGYVRDIRDAADRAISHIVGLDAEIVADNPFLQDGVVRCLILMGEAAKNLSEDVRAEFPDIDWSGMIGLRNILVHRYQEIDYLELWTIVNRDLEPVVLKLTAFLQRHLP